MTHALAQRAVVRMLFDPAFAEAVRRDPETVLAALEPSLRAQLAAVDPRAFYLDRLRRRRALRTLSEELKATTTLALAETRSLAWLERFFASSPFHRAVDERGSMPLAFAEFLAEAVGTGELRTPLLRGVLAIEAALLHARRAARAGIETQPGCVALQPGVIPIATTRGALAAMQQAEHYLFEVGLMPAVALCDDAPSLTLDERARDRTPLCLVTVPTASGITLVSVDDDYAHLLRAFEGRSRPRHDLIRDAVGRGLTRARAEELLRELLGDDLAVERPA
jgi:hypothetical protein